MTKGGNYGKSLFRKTLFIRTRVGVVGVALFIRRRVVVVLFIRKRVVGALFIFKTPGWWSPPPQGPQGPPLPGGPRRGRF